MEYIEREVGDNVWFFMGNHKGKMTKGKVLMVVELPGYVYKHYIIEIPSHVETIIEIRDQLTVSDAEDKPLGFYRNFKI